MSFVKIGSVACAATFVAAMAFVGATPASAGLSCAAGVCTGTITLGPTSATGTYSPLAIPLFDSNAGATLTGASWIINGSMIIEPGSTITNRNPDASLQTFENLIFSASDPNNSDINGQLGSGIFTDVYNQGPQTLTQNVAVAFGAGPTTVTRHLSFDDTSAGLALSDFQASGGGTTPLDVTTLTQTGLTGSTGNVSFNVITDAEVQVSIEYDYTGSYNPPSPPPSVPEPASLLLIGSGLAALGLVRRRKV